MLFLSGRSTRCRAAAAWIVLCGLSVGAAAYAAEPDSWTTVIVVRHAEKQLEREDPPLSVIGRQRAAELARALHDLQISGLYASQYRRAIETLEPLAETIGIEVRRVPLESTDLSGQLRAMAERILKDHRGSTVVVSGHSNTVPELVRALGVADPPALEESDYDDLFVVSVAADGSARLLHLHYGAVSP